MQATMRQMPLFAVVGVALVVLGGTPLAQSRNPDVGTWKLNVAKSKFSPGTGNRSGTVKIEAAGAGVKTIVDLVAVDGTVRHFEFTANYDGKDSPVVGNSANGDVVALTRVDRNTTKLVNKKGGKITTTQTAVVSSDGKTRTLTTTGMNPQGQTVNNVAVWDRQ
jgi:hypothetical protein